MRRPHYHLGMAYYAAGSMSEAARHFARSIEMDPSDNQSRRMFSMIGDRLSETRPGYIGRGFTGFLRPLRASLVAKVAVAAAVAFVVFGGILAVWMVRSADASDMVLARMRAEAVSDTVRDTLWLGEEASSVRLQQVVEALGKERAIVSLRIMSKNGRVLASTDAHEIGTSVSRADPACVSCHSTSAAPRNTWTEFREIGSGASRGLELLRPLFAVPSLASGENSNVPLGMLQMVTSLSDNDARRAARRIEALAVGGTACGAVVLLVAALVWYLVRRPLSMLETAVGPCHHSTRAPETGRQPGQESTSPETASPEPVESRSGEPGL